MTAIWEDPDMTPEERSLLNAALGVNWENGGKLNFREEQRVQNRRCARSARLIEQEAKVRCKCGTEAILGPGKGPHAARADCPLCKRSWWVGKTPAKRGDGA